MPTSPTSCPTLGPTPPPPVNPALEPGRRSKPRRTSGRLPKDLDAPGRAAVRQRKALPLLEAIKDWLDRVRPTAVPRTPISEAFTYLANQWDALTVYTRHGDLAIDNNAAERAIKPFAIGRKNWMFFGSDRGGQVLATLAGFTATCELFHITPWTWLRDTLTRLPVTPVHQLDTLLPTATA